MERAALASVSVLYDEGFDLGRVLVFCGPGNNGGDGIAVARLLYLVEHNAETTFVGDPADERQMPEIIFVGDPEKRSDETKKQQEIAESYGLRFVSIDDFVSGSAASGSGSTVPGSGSASSALAPAAPASEPTTIVDAIFGIGSVRAPAGDFLAAINYINKRRGAGAKVLSLDIPSGVCADTGTTPGEAVAADVTVTFAYKKRGLTIAPGSELAGRVVVKDIGIYRDI
jgi:NAD(P)H-hydrate epimerase